MNLYHSYKFLLLRFFSSLKEPLVFVYRIISNSFILFLVLFFLINNSLFAGGAGTTSANFLKIGVGARAVSLGDAYVSISDEINGLFWNPAGLSYSTEWEAGFGYNRWFEDISRSLVGCITPYYPWGRIGCSVLYMPLGTIDGRDRYDRELGEFSASDMLVMLSYVRKLKDLGFGVNLKYIKERLVDKKAVAYAMDIGVKKRVGDIDLGMVFQNMGQGLKFVNERDELPLTLRLGGSYRYRNFLFASDIIKDEVDYKLGFGAEYNILEELDIRLGYNTGQDLGIGIRAGFGIKFRDFDIDYGFGEYGELGFVHRLGVRKKLTYIYRYKEKLKEIKERPKPKQYVKEYTQMKTLEMQWDPEIVKKISASRMELD